MRQEDVRQIVFLKEQGATGGSDRRASMAVMRPKWVRMAGSTGMAVVSAIMVSAIIVTVCGPFCI